jgi:hypothetical protein
MYGRCLPSIVYFVDIFQPTSLGQRRILFFSSMHLRRHHRQCPHPPEISLSRLHPDTSEYKVVRVGKNMNRTRFRFLEVGSITVSPALRRYCVEDSQLDNSDNSDSLLEDSDIDADNNIKLPWPLHIVLMRVQGQVGIRSRPYPWRRGGTCSPAARVWGRGPVPQDIDICCQRGNVRSRLRSLRTYLASVGRGSSSSLSATA